MSILRQKLNFSICNIVLWFLVALFPYQVFSQDLPRSPVNKTTVKPIKPHRANVINSISSPSNLTINVGRNEIKSIQNDSKEIIKGSKQSQIGRDYSIRVGGSKNEQVSRGSSESVNSSKNENIGQNYQLQIGRNHRLQTGNDLSLSADSIILKVGDAKIIMKKNGDISIEGKKINIKGSGDVIVKGNKISHN